MSTFYIHNKPSPQGTVWIAGGRKKELIDIGIEVLETSHDWGNWVFLIYREDFLDVVRPDWVKKDKV